MADRLLPAHRKRLAVAQRKAQVAQTIALGGERTVAAPSLRACKFAGTPLAKPQRVRQRRMHETGADPLLWAPCGIKIAIDEAGEFVLKSPQVERVLFRQTRYRDPDHSPG